MSRLLRLALVVTCASLVACTGNNTDAGPSDAGPAGPTPAKFCVAPCESAADCATDVDAIHSEDNYACEDGVCVHLGCVNSGECRELDGFDGFARCIDGECTKGGCATPTDCANFGIASADEDNYTCEEGACIYQGCNDDAECIGTTGTGPSVCRTFEDGGVPTCIPACDAGPECAQNGESRDDDNWRCHGGACQYKGCNDDDECDADKPGNLCR